jgi:hypothetical protein
MEKRHHEEWRAELPRAARAFIRLQTLLGVGELPLNDYWYYAARLDKENVLEALWFYRVAVARLEFEENVPNRVADKIRNRVEELAGSASDRLDLTLPSGIGVAHDQDVHR